MVSVDVDNVASARSAVEHLIDLGHRDIAFISNGPLAYTSSRDRLMGYRQALEQASIAFDNHLIAYGRFTCDSGFEAMIRLLDGPLPFTAVFVASDVVALGAIRAIRQRDICVPNDISVVGFDDIPMIDYLQPGLTTVHLPITTIGFRAGEMLMNLIKAVPIDDNQIRLDTRLILRGSTAAPSSQTMN
jgi:DNA-binding LacI/PurR family transcriptional regulator